MIRNTQYAIRPLRARCTAAAAARALYSRPAVPARTCGAQPFSSTGAATFPTQKLQLPTTGAARASGRSKGRALEPLGETAICVTMLGHSLQRAAEAAAVHPRSTIARDTKVCATASGSLSTLYSIRDARARSHSNTSPSHDDARVEVRHCAIRSSSWSHGASHLYTQDSPPRLLIPVTLKTAHTCILQIPELK